MKNNEKDYKYKKKKNPSSNSFYATVYALLGIVLIIFAFYNVFQASSFGKYYDKGILELKEAAKPAEISLIIIEDKRCVKCFDMTPVVDSLKRSNIKIMNEKTLFLGSTEAEKLISKYSVDKVPAMIITGEIDKSNLENFERKDDVMLFAQPAPPYTDTKSNKIKGLVSSKIIFDSSCEDCTDFSQAINALKESGVTISSEEMINRNTAEGKRLINAYSLKILPTLILSEDLNAYDSDLIKGWSAIGSIEQDGSYITRIIPPPYVNLSTNKIDGLVSMFVLTDSSCSACYDPDNFHKPILNKMGVVLKEEKRIDISSKEGEYLVGLYNLKKVPTIILKGDMKKYPFLVKAWADVGSIESDGSFVFRKVEVAKQAYKDLNTQEIIKPTPPNN